ncbi:MAG: carboxypeptidase regulatory-like domain-containing protein [Planctomycetota bacterium]
MLTNRMHKHQNRMVSAALALAAILVSTLSAQHPYLGQRPTSMRGQLVDASGRPIRDAAIAFVGPAWTTASVRAAPHATSAGDGRFELPLTPGQQLADAEAIVIAATGKATVVLHPPLNMGHTFRELLGTPEDLGVLLLQDGATVRGKVRSQRAKALAQAGVSAYSALQELVGLHGAWEQAQESRAACDATGSFILAGTTERGIVLQARCAGYSQQRRHTKSAQEFCLFEMEPSGMVRGQLVHPASQEPLGAGLAWLDYGHQDHGHQRQRRVRTDAEGRFVLGIDLPGPFTVCARDLYHPDSAAIGRSTRLDGPVDDVALSVPATESITVDVRSDDDGSPIQGAHVYLRWARPQLQAMTPLRVLRGNRRAISNATGEATAPAPVDGQASGFLLVLAKGYAPKMVRGIVSIEAGEHLRVALTTGKRITGVVRDSANEPVADARVASAPENGSSFFGLPLGPSYATTTDASGRFEFVSMAPGNVRLYASAKDHGDSKVQELQLDGSGVDGSITIRFANGSKQHGHLLKGRLLGKLPGTKFGAGWQLRTHPGDSHPLEDLQAVSHHWRDTLYAVASDGSFSLPAAVAGDSMQLILPCAQATSGRRIVPLGLATIGSANLKLRLPKALDTLHGRVRGTNGHPLQNLAVVLDDTDFMFQPYAAVMVDDDGSFSLPRMLPVCSLRVVDVSTGVVLVDTFVEPKHRNRDPIKLQVTSQPLRIEVVSDEALYGFGIRIDALAPNSMAAFGQELAIAERDLALGLHLAEGQRSFDIRVPLVPLRIGLVTSENGVVVEHASVDLSQAQIEAGQRTVTLRK